jgi:hypothetical protein
MPNVDSEVQAHNASAMPTRVTRDNDNSLEVFIAMLFLMFIGTHGAGQRPMG